MTRDELLQLIDRAYEEGWEELDLAGNDLEDLPPEIGKLTQLRTMTLGKWDEEEKEWKGNNLRTLPPEIAQLHNLTTLDLWGNQITQIPEVIGKLTSLTSLSLTRNQITQIPEFIGQLTNLRGLYLSRNQITQIPKAIGQLNNLRKLYLSSNQITQIPEFIGQLTNLRELYLSRNQITQIPKAIGQLNNLEELALWDNQITQIPEFIGQLTNLRELYLSRNQITQIPKAIGNLNNLTELTLASNQIKHIPDALGSLINLILLDLGSNQIKQVPGCIGQLTSLTSLSLSNNQITQIPEIIENLVHLTSLSFSNNQITQIPESIRSLIELDILYLGGNQIREISESITQLAKLTLLSLYGNQITQIPESIEYLTKLDSLYLGDNQIREIPESIAKLSSLTHLYLGANQIREIPESIAKLSNLITLSLHKNQIREIPESIAKLSSLTHLYLGANQIREIPESIAKLSSLTTFSLHSNQIREIPESIAKLSNLTRVDLFRNQIKQVADWLEDLPKLKKLDLRHNPLPISPEVLGPADLKEAPGSIEGIFNYCRQLRSGEVRPLNEAKLLLVGQGSVGKTSLINRLIDNQFDNHEPQTDGLNVRTWDVHVNSKDVRLNVWDFGGQEIYHATHQFFLTKRSLYLLVCNCRTSEEENRIEYWLKLIESFGDQSPVIIIGNKKDEQPLDINRKALREKYPNIKAILETSCQTNEGIDELRQAITKEVGELSDVYNLLPLSWFEVKEHLEKLDQDFISYSQYACICALNQIPEEHNQEQLIGLLHNLGLVLNFRDHPILQSTNVLNPDWVTQGIYTLLSDEILKTETKGILKPEDLTRILDPKRYPANRHHYLTELMKEFQLCFPLSDCPTPKFLIPGLLPKEEPEDTNLTGDTLEFQYHYRILPDSIISRFIVLMHDKIHDHIYWRSGVMLAYREANETYNIARIKTDPEDRKIFISISGRETTRRLFLGLIRDTFNKIHSSFGNLEVSEWVPVPGHPDHPPLDYQDLLCLEEMGDRVVTVPRLKLRVDLRQLLDGYESIEARQRRRMGEDDRLEMHIHGDYIHGDKVGNDKVGNDKIGNDKIGRDKIEN